MMSDGVRSDGVKVMDIFFPAGEYKNSQEWFITRDTQDIRVVSV